MSRLAKLILTADIQDAIKAAIQSHREENDALTAIDIAIAAAIEID
jgi:hypothetical protein